jgi:hypothetical protein
MSQRSFASAEYAMKKKRTRRERFLAEMERIVPWSRLIAVIEPLAVPQERPRWPPAHRRAEDAADVLSPAVRTSAREEEVCCLGFQGAPGEGA